jgi:hypothetical protein
MFKSIMLAITLVVVLEWILRFEIIVVFTVLVFAIVVLLILLFLFPTRVIKICTASVFSAAFTIAAVGGLINHARKACVENLAHPNSSRYGELTCELPPRIVSEHIKYITSSQTYTVLFCFLYLGNYDVRSRKWRYSD